MIWWVDSSKHLCRHNQSKYLELPRQLILLIYVANLNDLIGFVYKIILDYQPTTIKLIFLFNFWTILDAKLFVKLL